MATKTYRALRHDIVRAKQAANAPEVHHPGAKREQIQRVLPSHRRDLVILELFGGQGNITQVYAQYGNVLTVEQKGRVYAALRARMQGHPNVTCIRADSYKYYHACIAQGHLYDVVDIDPYGFPTRFFPDVFLLLQRGFLFVTMPKPYVNILNGITATHLISYFGEQNPSLESITARIALWGLCHWRKAVLLDAIDCKSIWRLAFQVERVKATEYTGVRNR